MTEDEQWSFTADKQLRKSLSLMNDFNKNKALVTKNLVKIGLAVVKKKTGDKVMVCFKDEETSPAVLEYAEANHAIILDVAQLITEIGNESGNAPSTPPSETKSKLLAKYSKEDLQKLKLLEEIKALRTKNKQLRGLLDGTVVKEQHAIKFPNQRLDWDAYFTWLTDSWQLHCIICNGDFVEKNDLKKHLWEKHSYFMQTQLPKFKGWLTENEGKQYAYEAKKQYPQYVPKDGTPNKTAVKCDDCSFLANDRSDLVKHVFGVHKRNLTDNEFNELERQRN